MSKDHDNAWMAMTSSLVTLVLCILYSWAIEPWQNVLVSVSGNRLTLAMANMSVFPPGNQTPDIFLANWSFCTIPNANGFFRVVSNQHPNTLFLRILFLTKKSGLKSTIHRLTYQTFSLSYILAQSIIDDDIPNWEGAENRTEQGQKKFRLQLLAGGQ